MEEDRVRIQINFEDGGKWLLEMPLEGLRKIATMDYHEMMDVFGSEISELPAELCMELWYQAKQKYDDGELDLGSVQ